MTTRREFNRHALVAAAAAVGGVVGCTLDGPVCEASTINGVNWIPDVQQPVSYGIDYLGPASGAPRRMFIAYPSAVRFEDTLRTSALQTAAANAAPQDLLPGPDVPDERPILRHCLTRWPLVLLMHGGDNVLPLEGRHLYWRTMASALACCGFVVVVPNWDPGSILADEQAGVGTEVALAWQDVEWVRSKWRHAWWVDPIQEETLFVGHSLGAQVALTLAVEKPDCAGVVSLGGWRLSNLGLKWLERVWKEPQAPSLFMRTRGIGYETVPRNRWAALPGDRYEPSYIGGHFDYLDHLPYVPRERGPGDAPEVRPGACSIFPQFAAGILALFAARYLRAETVPPASLEYLPGQPTPAQLRYRPSLALTTAASNIGPGCVADLRWVVDGQAGSRTWE